MTRLPLEKALNDKNVSGEAFAMQGTVHVYDGLHIGTIFENYVPQQSKE